MDKSEEQLREYFRQQLQYDHKDYRQAANTRAVVQNQHNMIKAAIKLEAKKGTVHVLDVGCGWGDLSRQLDSYIADYVGVEPSLIELRRFERKAKRRIVRGVGENMGYLRDSSRSVILLNSVLDHCINWRKTFSCCKRILAPGGIIIISMENSEKIPIRIKRLLHWSVKHEDHVSFFSMAEFHGFLIKEGLVVEKSASIGFLFGMHHLSMLFPLPVGFLRAVNHLVDCCAGGLMNGLGQIMFFVARKPMGGIDDRVLLKPFQCNNCFNPIEFGMHCCESCHYKISYLDNDILDALPRGKLP